MNCLLIDLRYGLIFERTNLPYSALIPHSLSPSAIGLPSESYSEFILDICSLYIY